MGWDFLRMDLRVEGVNFLGDSPFWGPARESDFFYDEFLTLIKHPTLTEGELLRHFQEQQLSQDIGNLEKRAGFNL